MKKRVLLLCADLVILSGSIWGSFVILALSRESFITTLSVLVCSKVILFHFKGLYRSILRFAGLPLALNIIQTNSVAVLLSYFLLPVFIVKLPASFFVMDYLLSSFLVGVIRFAPRYISETSYEVGSKRVLIYGAGDLGEDLARKLLRNPEEYQLVGFVDDSKEKVGKRLHNFPIYGDISKLEDFISKYEVSELIIAISKLSGDRIWDVTRVCRKCKVTCRIVPSFPSMLRQDINIKNIDIADLLRREPKDLDVVQIKRFIQDKVILITGAGGSIGSEITRQCLQFGAKRLVLIDHSEYNLYALQEELGKGSRLRYVMLNVLDQDGLKNCFEQENPQIVFHAAAYKHVPLVEENSYEGVLNNVKGTKIVAELADEFNVHKFVLISTDKAVRPTNVMGASKRIAELFIQNLNVKSKTEYISVRFGNVLGSSGSVIPKFIEQINKGGPVTVTHPEVTRYFMLTHEAVQLVLQAGSIGNGGEIFILNMGQPVKIAEMAEDLIFLSGREPHKEIQIEYTGLRPGEKLYEELLHDETEKKTQYENITIGRATYMDWYELNLKINRLLKVCNENNRQDLLREIKKIVPEFMHAEIEQNSKVIQLTQPYSA